MARFTVHMTFNAPWHPVTAPASARVLGRPPALRILAGDGTAAVIATGVRADSPAEAAIRVRTEVGESWPATYGPILMTSWSATRQRVLAGARWRAAGGAAGGPGPHGHGPGGPADGDGDGGSAGVREPRRPLPGPGSLHASRQP